MSTDLNSLLLAPYIFCPLSVAGDGTGACLRAILWICPYVCVPMPQCLPVVWAACVWAACVCVWLSPCVVYLSVKWAVCTQAYAYVSVCLLDLYVSVSNKDFTLTHRTAWKAPHGKRMGFFTEIFNRLLQEIKLLASNEIVLKLFQNVHVFKLIYI